MLLKKYTFNCVKCGKKYEVEITEDNFLKGKYRKNCSRSCANSHSFTKERREKISKGVSSYFKAKPKKERFCKYCGSKIEDTSTVCKNCLRYTPNLNLFKKLNIKEKSLTIAAKKALEILKKEYFENKLTCDMIYDKYKIRSNTLFFFFKKHDINLRSYSESSMTSIEENRINYSQWKNKKFKMEWHTTWYGEKVFLRSSYEILLASKLDDSQIYYTVESLRIKYTAEDGTRHLYIPDFYIPSLNLIIETKSSYFYESQKENNLLKMRAAIDEGYLYTLLLSLEAIEALKL